MSIRTKKMIIGWFKGLLSAGISSAATGIASQQAAGLTGEQARMVAVIGAVVGVANFLAKSPIPGETQP